VLVVEAREDLEMGREIRGLFREGG
jgi:hypothetical protein